MWGRHKHLDDPMWIYREKINMRETSGQICWVLGYFNLHFEVKITRNACEMRDILLEIFWTKSYLNTWTEKMNVKQRSRSIVHMDVELTGLKMNIEPQDIKTFTMSSSWRNESKLQLLSTNGGHPKQVCMAKKQDILWTFKGIILFFFIWGT